MQKYAKCTLVRFLSFVSAILQKQSLEIGCHPLSALEGRGKTKMLFKTQKRFSKHEKLPKSPRTVVERPTRSCRKNLIDCQKANKYRVLTVNRRHVKFRLGSVPFLQTVKNYNQFLRKIVTLFDSAFLRGIK